MPFLTHIMWEMVFFSVIVVTSLRLCAVLVSMKTCKLYECFWTILGSLYPSECNVTPPPPTPSANSGHRYIFYRGTGVNWDQAKANCENAGFTLAVIQSQEEQDSAVAAIKAVIPNFNDNIHHGSVSKNQTRFKTRNGFRSKCDSLFG